MASMTIEYVSVEGTGRRSAAQALIQLSLTGPKAKHAEQVSGSMEANFSHSRLADAFAMICNTRPRRWASELLVLKYGWKSS